MDKALNPKQLIAVTLFIAMSTFVIHGECIPVNPTMGMLSDRFEHMASFENLLFLSRGDILFIKDLTDEEFSANMSVTRIPARISGMKVDNATLWLTLEGAGILPIIPSPDNPWLTIQPLIPIPEAGISDIHNDLIAVGRKNELILYSRKDSKWQQSANKEFNSEIKKIQITTDFLFVLLTDGTLYHATRTPEYPNIPLNFSSISTVGGNTFYQFQWVEIEESGHLFLDASQGLILAEISEDHSISSRFLMKNEGSKVILSMAVFDKDIFLRFPETIEWYQLNGNTLQQTDQLDMDLEAYAMPSLLLNDRELFLLNANNLPGDWSILSFDLTSRRMQSRRQLLTSVNQIKGFVLENNQLFMAVDQNLYRYPWDGENSTTTEDRETIQEFPTSILSMVAIPSGFVLSTNNLTEQGTELIFFSTLGGEARQTQKLLFKRGVQDLRSNGNFLTFYETEVSGEFRTLNLHMLKLTNGVWSERVFQETREKESEFLLFDITPLNDSVFFIEDGKVYTISYDHLKKTIFFESENGLRALGRVGDSLILEGDKGMIHLDPAAPDSDKILGNYTGWEHLKVTRNAIAMVQSKFIPDPDTFEILAMDERQFLYPITRIHTGVTPSQLIIQNLKLLFHTPYSFQEYDFTCPILANQYIWPGFSDLQLDLNTNFTPRDMVRWDFWDVNGSLIGRYFLEAELISKFNGLPLSQWPMRVNQRGRLQKITVSSSFPLYPVLSGRENAMGRFSIPYSGELYSQALLPHLASPSKGWRNELYLQFHPFVKPGTFTINWGGTESIELAMPDSGTAVYTIPDDFDETHAPGWLGISTQGLNSGFTGFSTFTFNDRIAAVGLEPDLSDFFIIPIIPSTPEFNWQGIAIANPYESELHLRLLGYDAQGQIVLDRSSVISPLEKLVLSTFEVSIPNADSVQWMNLITEKPTSAISVFGDRNNSAIAAFSLKPLFGKSLMLPGIKTGSKPDPTLETVPSLPPDLYETRLMLINTESTEGTCDLRAFSLNGLELGTAQILFGPKETVFLTMEELFPSWSNEQLDKLGTMLLTSTTETGGVCIRTRSEEGTIEAYRLYVLP